VVYFGLRSSRIKTAGIAPEERRAISDNRTVTDATNYPLTEVVLRPRLGRTGCAVAFAALIAATSAWVALVFFAIRNYWLGGFYLLAAVAVPIRDLLYVRNARLFANPQVVGKRSLLGLTTTCPRDDFDRISPGGGRSPQLWFYRKNGTVAFKVHSRAWAEDQIRVLTNYIGAPKLGPETTSTL
jgi:hypothetical protein